MLKLKKTAVAVLAFGSSAVFAGTMGPVCAPGNVTVPCERSAWEFGAEALYLQPSYSGVGYAGEVTTANSTGGTDERFIRRNNKWGWGFMIEGAYYFNTGNDLNLNWYHWNKTTDFATGTVATSASAARSIAIVGPVAGNFKPRWDAVNIEFGQHVDFGDARYVRFHGGAEYARINAKGTVVGTAVLVAPVAGAGYDNTNLTYNGFGPRVGADLVYGFGNGLGIYAKAASALLVGSQSFNDTFGTLALPAPVRAATASSISGSYTAIVPEMEGKLGASYTYSMAQGDLALDVGWMWVNYFHAQQLGAPSTGGLYSTSDFAVQGPYIGLKWAGNVA